VTGAIKKELGALGRLCPKFRVRRLALFGSATTEAFDPSSSDMDFAVEFEPLSPAEHADAYFGLIEELERVFHTRVDLVETAAVRNPYFLKAINATQELLYESA